MKKLKNLTYDSVRYHKTCRQGETDTRKESKSGNRHRPGKLFIGHIPSTADDLFPVNSFAVQFIVQPRGTNGKKRRRKARIRIRTENEQEKSA